ncbi:Aste57867_25234 [Aphanomyces stellatus]|uniref:Aste57867_25234 protein n=1 Tax=Aphanomyces stellatus TaxID=120398 RepID=A0A485LSR2_9STRA|nr:hypothetical protein As57867_025156 [Aphanomyces stellatus]VFU01861.1 Aste57867_25234 [Aphanomyces stellatus]
MADFAPEQLEQCILRLMAPDTQVIKEAEALLKQYLSAPASIIGMMTQLQGSARPEVRQYAALLMHLKVSVHWEKLDAATQAGLAQVLLQRVTEEPIPVVQVEIARIIAKVAAEIMPQAQWPELFNMITSCAGNANAQARYIAMLLLNKLNETIGDQLIEQFQNVKGFYLAGLKDAEMKVRVEAMRASCGIAQYLDESEPKDKKTASDFAAMVDPMIEILKSCMTSQSESEACDFMESFTGLSEISFPLLSKAMPTLVQLLLQIFLAPEIEPSTRSAANACLNSLIENKPKVIAKSNMAPVIFNAMIQAIAADNHSASGMFYSILQEEKDDDEEEHTTQMAQRTLDFMALSISPKTLKPIILQCSHQVVGSANPSMQKAGVLALGVVSEGLCEFLSDNLGDVLPLIYKAAASPHHNVREAACFSLGQFAEYLQPEIQSHYADIIPVALALLDDPTPDVKATSCYVLEVFTESMEPEEIEPFLNGLVEKLVGLIQTQKPGIQKLAISALGSVSVGAKARFEPYFVGVCDLLQPFLAITDKNYLQLRATAIECLGYLVVAMGAEKFGHYLQSIMPYVFQTMAFNDEELNDMCMGFIINASNIYKKGFAPYAETCVQAILPMLTPDNGVEICRDGDQKLEAFEDEDEIDATEHYFKVHTATTEMLTRAVQCIEALATNLGGDFDRFVPQILVALSLMVETIHESVRAVVPEACAALVVTSFYATNPAAEEAKQWVQGQLLELHPRTKMLLDKLMGPPLNEVGQGEITSVFQELLVDSDPAVVEGTLRALSTLTNELGAVVMAPYFEMIGKFAEQTLNMEHDTEQDDGVDDDDEDDDGEKSTVLDLLTELFADMAKAFGPGFLPLWQPLFPLFMQYLAVGVHADKDRAAILGCFGEVLPEIQGAQYVGEVVPALFKGAASADTSMQRNSAYSLGAIVRMSGPALAPQYMHLLQALAPLFNSKDEAVVDNACSAVASMITTGTDAVPMDQVLPVFLKALPLKADFTETENVYGALFKLLEIKHPVASAHLPQIVSIFAQSLGEDSDVDEEVQAKIKTCVKWLVATYPDQIQAAAAGLDAHLQANLQTAL